jgi:uncharacterized surface protein with fasciclin (FAS1) repeats
MPQVSRRHAMQLLALGSAATVLTACGGGNDDEDLPNIMQTLQANPQFSELVEALTAAELAAAFSVAGPITVFAPTNAAFAALLAELRLSKAALLADKPLLTDVLNTHLVNGRLLRAGFPVDTPITTRQGSTFTISSALRITDARGRTAQIADTDVITGNGVIHVIDRVLLPA